MSAQEPLVAIDVDLRDFAYMPLDVLRLRDSELASTPDAEVFRCNILSWCVSWHQVPAASLPDDDVTLARLLGFGRDVKGWKKVRANDGLRGWIKCSDGRLYHPVVAEKARESWISKLNHRARTESARKAREEARQKQLQEQSQSLSQTKETSVTETVTTSNISEHKGSEHKGLVNPVPPTIDSSSNVVSLPMSLAADAATTKPVLAKAMVEDGLQAACRATWGAYAEAYLRRYGVPPVRNAKVNSSVKGLVQRLGATESPLVAEWFVDHPSGYYAQRGHDIGALLADCEKLRTEWATGRVVTQTQARQSDRSGTTRAAVATLMAEMGAQA